jgi:DNA repair exonuclease SbcCD ATPase subunit
MLIILGFAVALLLALILGKMLWGQAIGVGKRRSRREDPVTIAALTADKDKLRAEAAMLSRKLELRLDDLKTRLAEQTAEVSRNRNRVDRLAGEIKDRDATIVERDNEVENLKARMVTFESELVTRTQNAQNLKEQLRDKESKLQNKTALIDGLQEQLEAAIKTNAIVGQADMSAKERLQVRISDLTDLSKQIEDQRLQLTQQHSELKTLTGVISKSKSSAKGNPGNKTNKDTYIEQLDSGSSKIEKQLEEAERETEELQKELERLDDDWNEKLKLIDDVKSSPKKAKKPRKPRKSKKSQTAKKTKAKAQEKPVETSNVVSLASRIRSLQSDLKGQKK